MIWIALALLAALFAYILERGLALIPIDRRWRYRLAFLISGATGLLLRPLTGTFFSCLTATLAGSFLGCLAVTAVHERLWEDNAPPPAAIQTAVLAAHRGVIGVPAPAPWWKRAFDLILALGGLLVSSPVWVLALFLIWIEDPGPVLFVKNSVGKGGDNFHQFKLRSMVHGAEQNTGPVLARESDERVLWVGRFLRKTALDELPQLLNILRGDMSFVGPRPQRTVLVIGYLEAMPEYAERARVQPGLAGLAQVAGDYYLTPRQKLRFDRLYIRHISLGFDLKLLLLAFLITFWYRWQKGWNGHLPRRFLHAI